MHYKMFESEEGHPPIEDGKANEIMARIEAVEMEIKRSAKRALSALQKIRHEIGGGALIECKKKPIKNEMLDHLVEIGTILAGFHLRQEFVSVESLSSAAEKLLGSVSGSDLSEAVLTLNKLFYSETGHILSSCVTPHQIDNRKNPTPHFLKTAAALGIAHGETRKEQYTCWATSVDYYRSLGEESFVNLLQQTVQPSQTECVDVRRLMERQRRPSTTGHYEDDEPEMG
jgi:hypothetical protein